MEIFQIIKNTENDVYNNVLQNCGTSDESDKTEEGVKELCVIKTCDNEQELL